MASGSMTTISSSHSTTLTESVLKLITGKPRDCRLISLRPPDLILDEPGKIQNILKIMFSFEFKVLHVPIVILANESTISLFHLKK